MRNKVLLIAVAIIALVLGTVIYQKADEREPAVHTSVSNANSEEALMAFELQKKQRLTVEQIRKIIIEEYSS